MGLHALAAMLCRNLGWVLGIFLRMIFKPSGTIHATNSFDKHSEKTCIRCANGVRFIDKWLRLLGFSKKGRALKHDPVVGNMPTA